MHSPQYFWFAHPCVVRTNPCSWWHHHSQVCLPLSGAAWPLALLSQQSKPQFGLFFQFSLGKKTTNNNLVRECALTLNQFAKRRNYLLVIYHQMTWKPQPLFEVGFQKVIWGLYKNDSSVSKGSVEAKVKRLPREGKNANIENFNFSSWDKENNLWIPLKLNSVTGLHVSIMELRS